MTQTTERARRHPRPPAPAAPEALPFELAELITDPDTRIVVCCGAGGVGKTTTSAALALAAAEAGRTVVVLTIDPARRLAQSLGLEELDNEPRRGGGTGGGGGAAPLMVGIEGGVRGNVAPPPTPGRGRPRP